MICKPLNFALKKARLWFLLPFFAAALFVRSGCAHPDAPLVPICVIQGSGFTSPRVGETLRAQGVVSADFDDTSLDGFFIQTANCDSDPATSDGIFVALDEGVNLVEVGDFVEVRAMVAEFYGQTRLETNPADVQIIASGRDPPPAVELQPPFENEQARSYFEALEGMRVSLDSGKVIGPTDARGNTWLVRSDLGIPRVFDDDPAGTGEIIMVGSEGLFAPNPAKVGDTFQGLDGVLDYILGAYKILLLTGVSQPSSATLHPGAEAASLPGFTFGSCNLDNLFDIVDDPETEDPVPSPPEYQRKLDKLALLIRDGLGEPDFLAVQEAENETVLQHLAARVELTVDYDVIWQNGPDRRGIDVGLLYNSEKVVITGFEAHQGCTALVDGLGPDGNGDVQAPQNALTCDTDGDGILDGNRLFSRPPLLVQMTVDLGGGENLPLWALVNHWKSKREDTRTQEHTLPRRLEQAAFVAALTDEIERAHPGAGVIVLGDLNDTFASQPLARLAQARLWNATRHIAREERYTYIYRGVSQTLDHVFVSSALAVNWVAVQPVHLGADYPAIYESQPGVYRASDHDPLLVRYTLLPYHTFLPLISR